MTSLTQSRPSFLACKPLFLNLSAPALSELSGDHEAAFVGPAWFRSVARFGLGLGGLPNWHGKRFDASGNGLNLLRQGGTLQAVMPMTARIEPSRLDGKPVAAVHYAPGSPFPWRHVVDELRAMESGGIVGMSLIDAPLLRRFPLPFLLFKSAI